MRCKQCGGPVTDQGMDRGVCVHAYECAECGSTGTYQQVVEETAVYLGDAVYIEDEGYHLRLYLSDGLSQRDTIYLNPGVQRAIVQYIQNRNAEEADAEHEDE